MQALLYPLLLSAVSPVLILGGFAAAGSLREYGTLTLILFPPRSAVLLLVPSVLAARARISQLRSLWGATPYPSARASSSAHPQSPPDDSRANQLLPEHRAVLSSTPVLSSTHAEPPSLLPLASHAVQHKAELPATAATHTDPAEGAARQGPAADPDVVNEAEPVGVVCGLGSVGAIGVERDGSTATATSPSRSSIEPVPDQLRKVSCESVEDH